MVFPKSDLELFKRAISIHRIQPLIREITSTINGRSTTLYEVVDFDRVTEYIIKQEMEALRNGSKL